MYNINIIESIYIGTFIYLILYKYKYIFQIYILDIILGLIWFLKETQLQKELDKKYQLDQPLNNKSKEYLPVKNLIIDQPNTFKDKENIKKKNKQNYIPKEISLNYTLSHTYKNVYSSNPR
jgi:hypothetical protein